MSAKQKSAAEINARMSEIGEVFARSMIAELLPNYRALNDELNQLRAEYPEALARESVPPTKEHLRLVREADERRARIERARADAAR